jgi:hypothetical protein
MQTADRRRRISEADGCGGISRPDWEANQDDCSIEEHYKPEDLAAAEPEITPEQLERIYKFGNIMGRGPWINAGGKHYCNEFGVFTGVTGRGRKGTGFSVLENATEELSPVWFENCKLKGIQ